MPLCDHVKHWQVLELASLLHLVQNRNALGKRVCSLSCYVNTYELGLLTESDVKLLVKKRFVSPRRTILWWRGREVPEFPQPRGSIGIPRGTVTHLYPGGVWGADHMPAARQDHNLRPDSPNLKWIDCEESDVFQQTAPQVNWKDVFKLVHVISLTIRRNVCFYLTVALYTLRRVSLFHDDCNSQSLYENDFIFSVIFLLSLG